MQHQETLQVSDLVLTQVPNFVKENHTKFVEFLTNYYEYLDQQENINDYIHHIIRYLDVDSTTLDFITNFFEELRDFPNQLAVDKRLLVKHVHDFYAAKGTSKSFELLFRILFDDDVEITYPSEQILRASDGDWKQTVFISIETFSGELPTDGSLARIQFENKYGKFNLLPTKIQKDLSSIGDQVYRVHFNSFDRILVDDSQIIYSHDVYGNRTFVGKLIKSPSKITIVNGGKYWQIGHVFKLPGSIDTVAKITGVGKTGVATRCEIIQHGFGHTENQNIIVSPFPNKPSGSSIEIDKVMISFNPTVYSHTITISDYSESTDSIYGITTEQSIDSYFLDDYASEDYSGNVIFSQINSVSYNSALINDTDDVTIEEWLASRTTFVYEFTNIVREKGYFATDNGRISNQMMHLADNRYYQMFSYLIKSGRQLSEYKNALHLVHPAGLKYFSELQKQFSADVSSSYVANRYMSTDKVYLLDVNESNFIYTNSVGKNFVETVNQSDSSSSSVGKYINDSVTYATESSSTEYSVYAVEDYSLEGYTEDTILVTLVN